MVDLSELLGYWEELGVFDILLPFLLIFTITFGVLQKSQLFGKDKKNLNVIVALVLALLFVRNTSLVSLVNRFLPNISIFMVVILMFLLLIGLFSGKAHAGWTGLMMGSAALLSAVFIVWALFADSLDKTFGGGLPDWWFGFDPQTKATIIFVCIFVILIWLITREPGGGKGKVGDWIKDRVEEMAGK
jgi:hypothetical protein